MSNRTKFLVQIIAILVFLIYLLFIVNDRETISPTFEKQTKVKNITHSFQHVQNLDLFKGLNVSFINYLKNPCWFENNDVKWNISLRDKTFGNNFREVMRCLPNFFLVGQPKSGTTDLFLRLSMHPDIISPKIKGTNWWTRARFGQKRINGTEVSLSAYIDEFNTLASHLQVKCGLNSSRSNISPSCKQLITCDASTSTFWDSSRTMKELEKILVNSKRSGKNLLSKLMKRRFGENSTESLSSKEISDEIRGFKFTVADIIGTLLPDARIVVILREPVDRLYSGYKYFKNNNRVMSKSEFDSFVRQSILVWKKCVQKHSDRFCAYSQNQKDAMKVRLYVGLYSIFLKDWFAVFPRDQILVIRTEDYKINLKSVLQKIFKHLGLRRLEEDKLDDTVKIPVVNKNRQTIGEMFPETKTRLRKFYKKFNTELAQLLKDKKYLWEDI